MTVLKPLPKNDYDAFTDLTARAYPSMDMFSEEARQRMSDYLATMAEDDRRCPYGAYRDGRLVGGMILYDFQLNVRGQLVKAGGVGMVAVNLLEKKKKVAHDMVAFFLERYRQADAPVTLLYPFRPDFYKRMGFGYGARVNVYKVRTRALPQTDAQVQPRMLTEDDEPALLTCANRFARATNGMVVRSDWELGRFLKSKRISVIGLESDGALTGYLVFDFETSDWFTENKLRIIEMVYQDRQTFLHLLSCARTQADQAEWTVVRTFDEDFAFLLDDPRHKSDDIIAPIYHESNRQGIGLMYKVVDVRGLLAALEEAAFGPGTCRVKIEVRDSMTPANEGSVVVGFKGGHLRRLEGDAHEVAISMDIAEFSSLIMGAVPFRKLFLYGRVEVSSEAYVDQLDALFGGTTRPVCMTLI